MSGRRLYRYALTAAVGAGLALAVACNAPVDDRVTSVPASGGDEAVAAPTAPTGANGGHDGHSGREPGPGHGSNVIASSGTFEAAAQEPLVVNVEVTDEGFKPEVVSLPLGRQVQLVFRNRTDHEHHYHVMGMEIDGLLWLSNTASNVEDAEDGAGGAAVSGTPTSTVQAASDHDHHGHGGLVAYHVCTSASGVCPTGDWVHAHSNPGEMDTIFFTPQSVGRFEVENPLVADMTALVVVYEP